MWASPGSAVHGQVSDSPGELRAVCLWHDVCFNVMPKSRQLLFPVRLSRALSGCTSKSTRRSLSNVALAAFSFRPARHRWSV